ncbi:hypothetical protein Efla_002984 [Eimeria flavescens]
MKLFCSSKVHHWWTRAQLYAYAALLVLSLLDGATSTEVPKPIAPHSFQDGGVPRSATTLLKATAVADYDAEERSFVQGGKGGGEIWVGLLDQEYIMQSSHALVYAFKRATKYIYSNGFVRQLFHTNPFLRYSVTSMEEKVEVVKQLEKISKGSKLLYWNKPKNATGLIAKSTLNKIFPMRRRLLGQGRSVYQRHYKTLSEALTQAKAGSKALDLILASNTLPMYTWTDSFFNHPFKTIQNTILQAFEDAVGGVSGLYSSEVKNSCFSFAYRVNSVAPYSAVYPGGVLGSIMKGLVRSYFLVFHQTLVNFKGIFALLIGVICKTYIIQAAVDAIKPLFRMGRRGLRAIQAFKSRTIAMRGDPVGQGLVSMMMKREAVVLITILFQLHAVDVKKQYEEAENIKSALAGGTGAWAVAEGLFIGASEFGRAFHALVNRYINSATAYVKVCEGISGGIPTSVQAGAEGAEAPDGLPSEELVDAALEFFPEAHPEESGEEEPLTFEQKLGFLQRSCKKNAGFVSNFNTRKLFYVQRAIQQMVRLLRYYFKYFKSYISELLAVFYETALAMLDRKINENLSAAEGVNSPAEEMAAAEARATARRSAAQSAIEDRQIPRKLFRATKFAEESQELSTGFFEAAGAFSLFQIAEADGDNASTKEAALRLLTASEASLRRGVGQIYQRFLNSQVLVSRLEKDKQRISVFDLIAKCHNPLEEKSDDEKETCGSIVTSELNEDEYVAKSLFAINLAISGPADDIAYNSTGQATVAFAEWAQYATAQKKKNAAHIALMNADAARHRRACFKFYRLTIHYAALCCFPQLTFRRFEHVEGENKLILYDSNGRSLTFIGNCCTVFFLIYTASQRIPKPDPLDCSSRFVVREGNTGTLEFFLAAGQRAGQGAETEIPRELQEVELRPAIALEGQIYYNDERKELKDIQNDPGAIRDTIVANFVEKRGRVAAETVAGILCMLHSRLPIFWKRSPVEFLQNLSPKMFFDALLILSTQAYDHSEATVMLEGKLYTFPRSFTALKDIVLSAVNRAILRMHNLNATDAALLIAMGSLHFAYKKIQKHRTGRTLLMQSYLKEVHHMMELSKTGMHELESRYAECGFFVDWGSFGDEDIIKCALYRYMKLGSLQVDDDNKLEIQNYLHVFVTKLAEMKGDVSWQSYLNLDYFLKTAKMYGKTAAQYRFETLRNQLNDVPGTPEEQSELERLMKKMHPSLSGYRPPRPKKKKGLLTMLVNLKQNFRILPDMVRKKVSLLWKNCYARLRRFFGSRRSFFRGWRISPKVIQGPHFMGALKAAEAATYPDLGTPREVFIEVQDLEEFGRILLTLETVAATLDSASSMYTTVTQIRATPAFSPSAKRQHESLVKRARLLGPEVTKVAAGWVLKAAAGASGVNMALGLLGLHDTSGRFMEKALQLRYLTSEALTFLESSLDLAYILMHAPQQTKDDVTTMRINLNYQGANSFTMKAQCEPKGLGVDIGKQIQVADLMKRLEEALENLPGFAHESGTAIAQQCEQLVMETLKYDAHAMGTLPHEYLVASPEAFGLCFLLVRLRATLVEGTTVTTLEQILQSTSVDGQSLASHLQFLQQRSASQEERKLRAKFISPLLRHLLIAAVENLGENLAGISFRTYDDDSKTLSFQYTLQEVSPAGTPAESLAYAADLLLGADKKHKCRFVAFAFEGPQFLMDWYKYIDTGKVRKYVDELRNNEQTFTYKAMSKLSNVYIVTDLVDLAYSLRQSSKLNAVDVAKKAAQKMLESNVEPVLRRYGLANILMDIVVQAERVKKQCLLRSLDEYEAFSASTILEKEMFRYDCFYSLVSESNAFADVARSVTEDDVTLVMDGIDRAYEDEAKQLYEAVIKSAIKHGQVASAAFKVAENFPITSMVEPIQETMLKWLRERQDWASVLPVLQAQRQTEWEATTKTATLGRPVTHLEHPMLMNPYQLLIDVLMAATTGSAKRRRMPVMAPIKRLKALYSIIKPDRKSKTEFKEDMRARREAARAAHDAYVEEHGSIS